MKRSAVPEDDPRMPEVKPYRPLNARRRLLILLLAPAIAALVMWMLLERPGAPPLPKPPPRAEPGACAPGQTVGCVGGKVEMIAPAAVPPPPASAAAPTAR